MSSILKLNKKYHFFDNGKLQNKYHYIATCIQIFTSNEAKKYKLASGKCLYDEWKSECLEFKGFYKDTTDYFVECNIQNYSEEIIWFVRNDDNDWVTLDPNNSWIICGILDVNKKLYKKGIGLFGKNYYNELL